MLWWVHTSRCEVLFENSEYWQFYFVGDYFKTCVWIMIVKSWETSWIHGSEMEMLTCDQRKPSLLISREGRSDLGHTSDLSKRAIASSEQKRLQLQGAGQIKLWRKRSTNAHSSYSSQIALVNFFKPANNFEKWTALECKRKSLDCKNAKFCVRNTKHKLSRLSGADMPSTAQYSLQLTNIIVLASTCVVYKQITNMKSANMSHRDFQFCVPLWTIWGCFGKRSTCTSTRVDIHLLVQLLFVWPRLTLWHGFCEKRRFEVLICIGNWFYASRWTRKQHIKSK